MKKQYNVLTNGFKQIMAKEGVFKLSDTKLFDLGDSDHLYSGYEAYSAAVKSFKSEFIKHFKAQGYYAGDESSSISVSTYPLNSPEGSSSSTGFILLADGAIISSFEFMPKFFSSQFKNLDEFQKREAQLGLPKTNGYSMVGYLTIDVNGEKKPNVIGRDIFEFWVGNDGNLYPQGGLDVAAYLTAGFGDNFDDNYWRTSNNCNPNGGGDGSQCAGLIIEEGWQMNY